MIGDCKTKLNLIVFSAKSFYSSELIIFEAPENHTAQLMRSYLKLLKIAPEITRPEQEAQKAGADGSSTGKKPRGFSAPGAFGMTGRSPHGDPVLRGKIHPVSLLDAICVQELVKLLQCHIHALVASRMRI